MKLDFLLLIVFISQIFCVVNTSISIQLFQFVHCRLKLIQYISPHFQALDDYIVKKQPQAIMDLVLETLERTQVGCIWVLHGVEYVVCCTIWTWVNVWFDLS